MSDRQKDRLISNTDERNKYWNEEYFNYCWQRVEEANHEKGRKSKIVQNDI